MDEKKQEVKLACLRILLSDYYSKEDKALKTLEVVLKQAQEVFEWVIK